MRAVLKDEERRFTPMNGIAFGKQQLSQIGAILSSDTGNQSGLGGHRVFFVLA